MSHCHHEHGHHGHGPSDAASHDHSDDVAPALENHIYQQIDFDAVTTLNESQPGAGSAVLQKPWTDRLQPRPELCSDADEQLLMHVPFTAQIRLHSIVVRTGGGDAAPMTLHVYANRDEGLDFGAAAELPPTQTLQLAQSPEVQEVPVRRARFNAVRSLHLFFACNWGRGHPPETRIAYLAFKGDWLPLSREPVSFLYEAAPNPADHALSAPAGENGLASAMRRAGGGM